jgi:hypothetical protein
MVSPIFSNKEVNLLHALRSRSTECKTNPKQKYIHTNLLCTLCETEADDQPHLMRCTEPFNKLKNLRELSQPQEGFAPKFKRNWEKIFDFFLGRLHFFWGRLYFYFIFLGRLHFCSSSFEVTFIFFFFFRLSSIFLGHLLFFIFCEVVFHFFIFLRSSSI